MKFSELWSGKTDILSDPHMYLLLELPEYDNFNSVLVVTDSAILFPIE